MKFIFVCFLLMGTVTAVLGVKADCAVDGQNIMAGEQYYPPRECFAMTCDKDGGLSGVGCPRQFSDDPKCTLVPEDNSKPYPDCCEHYNCE